MIDFSTLTGHVSGHENEVNQVRINAKKTMIASCSDDRTARVWMGSDIRSFPGNVAPPHVTTSVLLRGHTASVNSIGWSGGDREMVATFVSFLERLGTF